MELVDTLNRPLRDLRISVTDRCNFRCVYCMPREVFGPNYKFLARTELLTFEEITRLARQFAALGVEKFRLTGGEPLLRRELERLIQMLAEIPGVHDIALTTNGSLLTPQKANALRDAGLKRISISLDSLDDAVFKSMNDVGVPVSRILEAIDNASRAGLAPVKIDAVMKRGVNDAGLLDLAGHFRGSGHIIRFIEYMDVGNSNQWQMADVVSAEEIIHRINGVWPIEPAEPTYYGEVAQRWRYKDGGGELGIIASVTKPFCRTCTRARLSAEGSLYTCLFSERGHDLRQLLRSGASNDEVNQTLRRVWGSRRDRYSELRTANTPARKKVEMSHIGG